MWRYLLLFGILTASPSIGLCDTVQFAVPPADIGTTTKGGTITLLSSGLNGTTLAGQSLSLDLVFSNDELARIFALDPSSLGITLIIGTNAAGAPGFAGPNPTGFLLAPNGSQFGDTLQAGRADSNGSFSVGLNSFTPGNLNNSTAFDLSGAHFDITLPSTLFTITQAQLSLSLGSLNAVEFGTVQQLSEPSTLAMTLMGGLMIAFAAYSMQINRLRERQLK